MAQTLHRARQAVAALAVATLVVITSSHNPIVPTHPLDRSTGSFGLDETDLWERAVDGWLLMGIRVPDGLFGGAVTGTPAVTADHRLNAALAAHAEADQLTRMRLVGDETCEDIAARIPVPPGVTAECAPDPTDEWFESAGASRDEYGFGIAGFFDERNRRLVVDEDMKPRALLETFSHEAGHAWDWWLLDDIARQDLADMTGGQAVRATPREDMDAHLMSAHETFANLWATCQVGADFPGWFDDPPECSDAVRLIEQSAARRLSRLIR